MDWCYKTLNQTIFAIYLQFSLNWFQRTDIILNNSFNGYSLENLTNFLHR